LLLFNLNPKESAKIVFGRESELDELVHLMKARRRVAVLGPRISSYDLPSATLTDSVYHQPLKPPQQPYARSFYRPLSFGRLTGNGERSRG